jgi:esterase/lipase
MLLRYLLCLVGILLAVPVLALIALAFVLPVTVSGGFYLLGSFLLAIGLILAPWKPGIQKALMLSGLIGVLLITGFRLGLTLSETSKLKVIVLPSGKGLRPVNVLIDEQDTLLFGEEILHLIGGVSPHEHEGLAPAVTAAFREARASHGIFSSPIVSTYLGLQKPDAFDVVLVEPSVEQPAQVGVLFLHGYTGNVSVQCWEIARAVEKIGAVTVCPSTSWVGDWWKPEGEAILRATLHYLRDRGVQRIYLGGFSNGGHGVGSLVSTLVSEQDINGLFFIAGIRNAAEVRETDLPVLVIQGVNDDRIPVEAARQFAVDVGKQTTYVELDADHFLIMKSPQSVQEALGAWLIEQEKH